MLSLIVAHAASPALESAHRAWLDHDPDALVAHTAKVLRNGSPRERENVLDLLEVAWEDARGRLPGTWELPPGVGRLAVDTIHIDGPEGERWQLTVRAWTDERDTLADLHLVGPDTDLTRRTAAWDAQPEEGGWYVELEGPERATPPSAGLYDLTLTTADRETPGWLALTDVPVGRTPVLTAPKPGGLVHGDVRVGWEPCAHREDQHTPGTGVWITRTDGGRWVPAWSTWSGDPELSQVAATLDPGAYRVAVSCRDTRSLGPVQVGRVSRTARAFRVDR